MGLPNCFACTNRSYDDSKKCEYLSECVANGGKFFKAKPRTITRGEKIRLMDTNHLAEFLASLRPDMKDANLKNHILTWLNEPCDGEVSTIWFMK